MVRRTNAVGYRIVLTSLDLEDLTTELSIQMEGKGYAFEKLQLLIILEYIRIRLIMIA